MFQNICAKLLEFGCKMDSTTTRCPSRSTKMETVIPSFRLLFKPARAAAAISTFWNRSISQGVKGLANVLPTQVRFYEKANEPSTKRIISFRTTTGYNMKRNESILRVKASSSVEHLATLRSTAVTSTSSNSGNVQRRRLASRPLESQKICTSNTGLQ